MRIKLVLDITALPFLVLIFISCLRNMIIDITFPNNPKIPTTGIITPLTINVKVDPVKLQQFTLLNKKIHLLLKK